MREDGGREEGRQTAAGEPRSGEPSRPPSPVSRLLVCNLGICAYASALALQRAAAQARISGSLPHDLLLLVEHPPVITMGRSSKGGHLVASPSLLAARGVEYLEVDRGGDVTFHGPGQLVGYPIIDLKRHKQDLHWYLRQVEEALIRAIAPFGIDGIRNPGYTGVWVNDRKLASIGVHARDWVTWHGFALNVTTDLSWFDLIVPCGIAGVTMTSMELECARTPLSDHAVHASVVRGFETTFSLVAEPLSLDALRSMIELAGTGT
ncbi:MAG: lipoyl(octanoyl) transferase LipB [Gemmatimonadota bacterium]